MAYITGQLVDPMNKAIAGAVIKVTAFDTLVTLAACSASVKSDTDGYYDFELVNGVFDIEVMHEDVFVISGRVLVDGGVANSLNLLELLSLHQIAS